MKAKYFLKAVYNEKESNDIWKLMVKLEITMYIIFSFGIAVK